MPKGCQKGSQNRPKSCQVGPKTALEAIFFEKSGFSRKPLKTNEKSTFLRSRVVKKQPKIVPRRPQDGLISILCSLRFSHRFLITFCLDFGGIWGGLGEPRSVIFGIDFHMSCQDRPKSGQERPKSRPRGQKGTQKAAKRHPRAPKKAPKSIKKDTQTTKQKIHKRQTKNNLTTSNLFAAVGHGLALANSTVAFRFQLLRFLARRARIFALFSLLFFNVF